MIAYFSPFNANTKKPDNDEKKRTVKERLISFKQSIENSFLGFGRVLRLVWDTDHWLTIGIGGTTLLEAFFPATLIYINKLLLDTIVSTIKHGKVSFQDIRILIILIITELSLNILSTFLNTLSTSFQELLQSATSNYVQYMVINHVNSLDLSHFERSDFYDTLRQTLREATMRPVTMVSSTFQFIRDAFVFSSMIFLLVRLQWILALIVLLAPIAAFISSSRYSKQSFQLMQQQSPSQRMIAYFVNLLTTDTSYKEIHLLGLSNYFLQRFSQLTHQLYHENQLLLKKRSFGRFLWGLLTPLASSGVYLYVALQALYGAISLGDLTLYTQAAISIQTTFQNLLNEVALLYENNLYLTTLFTLLAYKSQIKKIEHPLPIRRPFQQGIEFRNVTYQYEGAGQPSLRNVSFTLSPGKTLALVGHNGAGKSTLVKLLTRFYEPQEGQILLDGHDIREYDPDQLRNEFGVIFQDYINFQLTAQESIGIGNLSEIDDYSSVATAAERGGAAKIINKFPEKYNTLLGRWFENGRQLSGGEWQKIALSRTFMRKAQIFILDEPTAALDAQAEYDLFSRIRELTQDRMTIFISHRFSTVRYADYILVLEGGEIVEQGSHEELLHIEEGRYSKLFNLQASTYK